MSATRDPSQKHTFVYSNLYQLYRKGKAAATEAKIPSVSEQRRVAEGSAVASSTAATSVTSERRGLATNRVIKIEEMNSQPGAVGLRVTRHVPPSLLGKRIEPNRTALTPKAELGRRQAIDGLRDNLRQLQSLHERLRFMLKEIEELSGDDKK